MKNVSKELQPDQELSDIDKVRGSHTSTEVTAQLKIQYA